MYLLACCNDPAVNVCDLVDKLLDFTTFDHTTEHVFTRLLCDHKEVSSYLSFQVHNVKPAWAYAEPKDDLSGLHKSEALWLRERGVKHY